MAYRKSVTFSMILMGATAMVSQIVFMREFLVVFYGNEISIGVIFASWLIWGAFGSSILGRFSDRARSKTLLFSLCQLSLAFILPLTFLAIRLSKTLMGISPGEIIGYYPMMLATFVILCLSCSIMGFMFSLGCRVYRGITDIPAEQVARVYVLEAVGALTGGLVVSYFLIRHMKPFDIIFLVSLLNFAGAFAMQLNRPGGRKFAVATSILAVAVLVWMLAGGVNGLRRFSLARLWTGFTVAASRDSVYGNITVTRRDGQRSFYENGLHLYTVPDLLSAEESVHFALLEDKAPRDVLLIGGGVGGLLEQILKHPVKSVDYVELDPTIIKMAEEYLSNEDSSFLDAPEVRIINEDGRFYVKKTSKTYDCVIIHLGDPYTAQINRFYTVGFYRELSRILKEGAVVSMGLTSSANYIGEELKAYLGSVYLSLREVFPDILIIPGDTAFFLASNREGTLTADTSVLMERLKERGIEAKYVREYYLFDKLSSERVEYAREAVEDNPDVSPDRDFRPISYYYATVFWSTQFDTPAFRAFLRSVTRRHIWLAAAFFCLLIFPLVIWNKKRRGKRGVLLAVMTTGFAEINFQIVVLLSFQVIYGYVFYKLGVIITSFMVGLALGGWIIAKRMPHIKDDMAVFRLTQASICLYPLILPVVFLLFSKTHSGLFSWMGSNVIFPFLPVISGTIGGIQFPLANKIYLEDREQVGRVAGLSYGLDLLGACLGSFLAAAFLVPVLGIFQTCFMVALINLAVLGILVYGDCK